MNGAEDPHELGPRWLEVLRRSPRSYPEDYTHENGNYCSRCYYCHRLFIGHKRRFICKKCLTPNKMKVSIFNPYQVGILGIIFLTLAFVDVLVKEYTLGQGPIVNSLSIMSPGGKACALLSTLCIFWVVIFLPIRSVLKRYKNDNRDNRK